jgi:hypothetical protein
MVASISAGISRKSTALSGEEAAPPAVASACRVRFYRTSVRGMIRREHDIEEGLLDYWTNEHLWCWWLVAERGMRPDRIVMAALYQKQSLAAVHHCTLSGSCSCSSASASHAALSISAGISIT